MSSAYTPEQTQAVTELNSNVTVLAGAGSGKTKVLVKRFLYLLGDNYTDYDALNTEYICPADAHNPQQLSAQEILAITFTEKAGKEMAERLHARLQYLATNTSERVYWEKRTDELSIAHVGTMHSFYSKIIRENPVEAHVSPDFTLLNNISEKYHTKIFLNEYIQILLNKKSPAFVNVYTYYGSRNLQSIFSYITKSAGTLPDNMEEFSKILQDNTQSLVDLMPLLEEFQKTLQDTFTPGNIAQLHKSARASDLSLLALQNFTELFSPYEPTTFEQLFLREDIGNAISSLQGNHKLSKAIKKSFKEIISTISKNKISIEVDSILPDIITLLFSVLQAWRKYKERNSFLTFDDTEYICYKLFREHHDILQKYQNKYKHIMIDEVQDLNKIQHEIISLLSSAPHIILFTVGDPKQSIYGFRGSNPQNTLPIEKSINLDVNFRSTASVIHACNSFFDNFTQNRENNVEFTKLSPFRESDDVHVHTSFYEKTSTDELADLSKRIICLHERENADFSDIAVLVRTNSQAMIVAKQLDRYNIPYKAAGRIGFFDDPYIADLLNLLKVLNNQYTQIELIGVLRSPFFGINDESLEIITTTGGYIWQEIAEITLPNTQQQKLLQTAVHILHELANKSQYYRVSELLHEILYTYHWQAISLLQNDPLQNLANLEKMQEIVREFEDSNSPYLFEFIEYLRQVEDDLNMESLPNVVDSQQNGVNIMSIHKSKGLEFKYLFIPCLEKINIKGRAVREVFVVDPESGKIGLKFWSSQENKYTYSTEFERIHSLRQEFDNFETLRILYVAMTRAKDKLCLSGTRASQNSNSDKTALEWVEKFLPDIYQKEIFPDFATAVPLTRHNTDKQEHFEIVHKNILPLQVAPPTLEYLSASKIDSFLACPQMFAYQYIEKIPTVDVAQKNAEQDDTIKYNVTLLGTIVHKLLEECKDISSVEGHFIQPFSGHSSWEIAPLIAPAKELVKKYLQDKIYQQTSPHIIKHEYHFDFLYSPELPRINGYIDCLLRYPDSSYGIIDYKTGHSLEASIENYKLQLAIYKMICTKIFQTPITYTAIHYLGNEIQEIILSDAEYQEAQEKVHLVIKSIVQAITENRFPVNTSHCNNCQYNYLCPQERIAK